MKLWKKLVLIPYAILIPIMAIGLLSLDSGGIGGIIVFSISVYLTFFGMIGYTLLLAAALAIRWLILRSRKRSTG